MVIKDDDEEDDDNNKDHDEDGDAVFDKCQVSRGYNCWPCLKYLDPPSVLDFITDLNFIKLNISVF